MLQQKINFHISLPGWQEHQALAGPAAEEHRGDVHHGHRGRSGRRGGGRGGRVAQGGPAGGQAVPARPLSRKIFEWNKNIWSKIIDTTASIQTRNNITPVFETVPVMLVNDNDDRDMQ